MINVQTEIEMLFTVICFVFFTPFRTYFRQKPSAYDMFTPFTIAKPMIVTFTVGIPFKISTLDSQPPDKQKSAFKLITVCSTS